MRIVEEGFKEMKFLSLPRDRSKGKSEEQANDVNNSVDFLRSGNP